MIGDAGGGPVGVDDPASGGGRPSGSGGEDGSPCLLVGRAPSSLAARFPRLSAQFWSVIGRVWDDDRGLPSASARTDVIMTWLDQHGSGAARVLEIGCGTGASALALAEGPRRVVATDVADGMLRRAAARVRASGATVALARVDANARLPFRDGAFDAVVAMAVLDWVDAPARLLGEIRRTLRPHGLVLLTVVGTGRRVRHRPTLSGWLLFALRALPGSRRRRSTCTWTELVALVKDAGFTLLDRKGTDSALWRDARQVALVARVHASCRGASGAP